MSTTHIYADEQLDTLALQVAQELSYTHNGFLGIREIRHALRFKYADALAAIPAPISADLSIAGPTSNEFQVARRAWLVLQ